MFDAVDYDKISYMENAMKKVITFLTIPLLASCATLKPAAPETSVTPIEQMSTYQLQDEYLEVEHKINEMEINLNWEKKFEKRKSRQASFANLNYYGSLPLPRDKYYIRFMETNIEKYKLRLSDIKKELTKRGMY